VSPLSKVFELNRKGLNVPRGLAVLGVLAVPLIVLEVAGKEQYWLSAAFGALFVGLSDPGGEFGYRATRMGLVAVIGALLTALGFGIGARAWGPMVIAAFAVTLLGGLAVKFGLHRFVAGLLLNDVLRRRDRRDRHAARQPAPKARRQTGSTGSLTGPVASAVASPTRSRSMTRPPHERPIRARKRRVPAAHVNPAPTPVRCRRTRALGRPEHARNAIHDRRHARTVAPPQASLDIENRGARSGRR
jgi:hypothetical protein